MAGFFDGIQRIAKRVRAGILKRLAGPTGGRVGGYLRLTKLPDSTIQIACKACRFENRFQQPHPIHAGFSDQGFLYNDAGDLTLTWSIFDPAYEDLMGPKTVPWEFNAKQRALFEKSLLPATHGGHWRFSNAARCTRCHEPISGPMTDTIYYLRYAGSPETEGPAPGNLTLSRCLRNSA
jgi:hypothetical protein